MGYVGGIFRTQKKIIEKLFLAFFLIFITVGCQTSDLKGQSATGSVAMANPQVPPATTRTEEVPKPKPNSTIPIPNANKDTENSITPLKDNTTQSDSTSENLNNKAPYAVVVSLAEQRVRVFQKGELIKEMVVSTGTEDKPTPKGNFRIQNRGSWFFSSKYQQGAKWWVSFKDWGVYLFHSIPMDNKKGIIEEEAIKLGSPASHGCIRLSVDDARWFYDTIPEGTQVNIL